ncbi:MAG: sulfatase-like hydrolase/transferase [Pseudomonadota bacterium]
MDALTSKRQLRQFEGVNFDFGGAEAKRLANWLLVWIGLANIAFVAMWAIGAPPRAIPIVVAAVVGLLFRNSPAWLKFAAFGAVMAFSVLWFIAAVFNLAITSLLYSLRFMIEIRPAQSVEYIAVAALLGAVSVAAWFAVKRDSSFSDWRASLIAVGSALALIGVDAWVTADMRGHYERSPSVGAPFESAMAASDAERVALAGNRNLAIIMVESLGVPTSNSEMKRLLFAGLETPVMQRRFESTRGTSLYYNSTTAGEIRELCGRWGEYHELVSAGGDLSCLPGRMRQAGYSTHAYHSFEGPFFDRATWYPGIGFDRTVFAKDMIKAGAEPCGGVFPGACDRDIPEQLARQLKAETGPQFVYWLTVNSHLPVPTEANLKVDRCERVSGELARDFPMICRQFALWQDMEKALAREVLQPGFPPTDFLIVGDHMPPYFETRHRREFAPDRVPWIHLRWRPDADKATTAD